MASDGYVIQHLAHHPAVVVGQDSATGLQTARILSARGIPVIGVADNPRHFGCRTRACNRIIATKTSGEELLECLEELGPTLPIKGVLFPCSDRSVLSISRGRRKLESWYHIALPDPETLELLLAKNRFASYCHENGFPTPRTMILGSRSDAEDAAERLDYPCVLKPSVRTVAWDRGAGSKVLIVNRPQDLLGMYDHLAGKADELVIQEWIVGSDRDLFTCNCYFDAANKPLVTFVTRKLRQWPPDIGVGSLAQECRNDEVLEETLRLFQGVNMRGLAYLEMKRDTPSDNYLITEANIGRPTGRSATAEAGGVELLYTMYCDLLGWRLPDKLQQRYTEVKWIYLRQDIRAAFYRWRHGELTFAEWLKSLQGAKTFAVFSWSDPLPFVLDLLHSIGRKARKLFARHVKHAATKPRDDK